MPKLYLKLRQYSWIAWCLIKPRDNFTFKYCRAVNWTCALRIGLTYMSESFAITTKFGDLPFDHIVSLWHACHILQTPASEDHCIMKSTEMSHSHTWRKVEIFLLFSRRDQRHDRQYTVGRISHLPADLQFFTFVILFLKLNTLNSGKIW
jgi:hypothetical protein